MRKRLPEYRYHAPPDALITSMVPDDGIFRTTYIWALSIGFAPGGNDAGQSTLDSAGEVVGCLRTMPLCYCAGFIDTFAHSPVQNGQPLTASTMPL